MGSGSFGGGSGSFGGGGSGAGGPATGGTNGNGGSGAGGTDSAHERILKLTKLTESVNDNPEIAGVRATIYKLLQDRTRSAFLKTVLSDPTAVSAYKAVLTLQADLRGGATAATAASKAGGQVGGTLADLADAICQTGLAADTDERTESIVRRAVRDLLLSTVGNKQDFYYESPVESLAGQFDPAPLANTADAFLGTLIGETVRRDLLSLSAEAQAVVGKASREIAVSWTDKFKDRRQKTGTSFREMLKEISENYLAYSGGKE